MGRRPCIVPGCRGLTIKGARHSRCEVHAPKPFAKSKMRQAAAGVPQGQDWQRVRAQVMYRDGELCTVCSSAATEVDHILPVAAGGDPVALSNLRALCSPCHATATTLQRREHGWNA